jgi:hypothetical protein
LLAQVNYERLLSNYPGPISMTMIQCPDPQFKTRLHKRRIVQPGLAEAIARMTAPGGLVYLSSDVLQVAVNMREIFEAATCDTLHMSSLHSASPSSVPAASDTDISVPREPYSPHASSDDSSDAVSSSSESAACIPLVIDPLLQAPPQSDQSKDSSPLRLPKKGSPPWEQFEWLPNNPMGLPTEREISVLKHGNPMYRTMLCKPLLL